MANTATCEPCDVATTVTKVAGGQSIVDKAQKHSIFQDIIPSWNDQEFKGNFCVSCECKVFVRYLQTAYFGSWLYLVVW